MTARSTESFRLDNRVIAVVGAGSGIGEAVALGCGRQGAKVVCLDLDGAAAAAVAETISESGGDAESGGLDIAEGQAVTASFDSVRERLGALDGVVCTPAVNVRKPLLDYSDEEFDRVVDLNLKGSLHVLQSAGRIMRDQGSGSVVVFSSIRSLVVEPGQGVYAATKAGLVQMTRALAVELGEHGVRANAIAPGVVETPLTQPILSDTAWAEAYARRNALGRWAQPEEMVGAAVFLLSDAASYITGSVLFVDGGWTAIDGRFRPPGM